MLQTICPIPVQPESTTRIKKDPSTGLCLSCLMMSYKSTTPPLKFRCYQYTFEEALSFNHKLQINDDQIKILQRDFEVFLRDFGHSPQQNYNEITKLAPIKDVTRTKIISALNKLTSSNFQQILQTFDEIIPFCDHFENQFSEVIFNMASTQKFFSPLYSQFTSLIQNKATNPNLLKECLAKICFSNYENMTEDLAFFIGSLVKDKVFDPKIVYLYIKKLFEINTTRSYELLFNMMIQSGEIIESTLPDARDFFDNLFSASKSQTMRIRFLMADLEECRKNNWDVTSLLPSPPQATSPSLPIETTLPKEGEIILRVYIAEDTIPTSWSNDLIKKVLLALLQATKRVFDDGISILTRMKEQDVLTEKIAISIFRDVISLATKEDIISEYPRIRRRLGALFAQLVYRNIMQFAHFGSGFPFELEFFGGFLNESSLIGLTEKIKNSPWMSQMRFKPKYFSHIKLTNVIEKESMTECWDFYDLTSWVIEMMNDDEDPNSIVEMIESEFPNNFESIEFVEFVTEVIVLFKPKKYINIFSKYVKPHCDQALCHIAMMGKYYEWDDEVTRSQILGFAYLFDYNLEDFEYMIQ